jgi:hypothetical protein
MDGWPVGRVEPRVARRNASPGWTGFHVVPTAVIAVYVVDGLPQVDPSRR